MKERKVPQKMIKRHIHHQRGGSPWRLSPVIIAELVIVMIIAGVGVSFALTQNTVTTTASPWAGTADITQSTHFGITNYNLSYNSWYDSVNGVTLVLTNSSGTTASINIAVLNTSTGLLATNQTVSQSYPAGSYLFTWPNVSIASVDKINIVLTEP